MMNQGTWFEMLINQNEYPNLALPKADKTNIKNWNFENVELKEGNLNKTEGIPKAISHLVNESEENIIIICDGMISYQKLSSEFEGVIISTIQEAVIAHESIMKSYFGQLIAMNENRLTALNLKHLNSGLMIYLPKNKVIKNPLNVIVIQKEQSLMNHNLIIMEQGSQFKYIENVVNDSKAIVNLNTEIVVGENAFLDYAQLEGLTKETVVYGCRKAKVESNGRLVFSHGALSSGQVISENKVSLVGNGANADLKTVAIAEGKQKQNITVEIEHLAPHTEGNIVNHGISKDEAQITFNGIGKILSGMRGSNAQQSSRAMILSKAARADANPMLLIEEYDVNAGHAASVGKIDEEQLYYLMSRGLTRRESETLIIHGFLMPFISEIKNEAVQNEFIKVIEEKIK